MDKSSDEWRVLLERQLARLTGNDAGHNASAGSATVELDQSRIGRLSRMDALQGQAMSLATDSRRRAAISRTHAALLRLDEDRHGDCLECGERIAEARLLVDPAAEHCIACASTREAT